MDTHNIYMYLCKLSITIRRAELSAYVLQSKCWSREHAIQKD